MNIRIHIERLVLDGLPVDSRQRPVLKSAVEEELRRRIAGKDVAKGLLGVRDRPYTRGSDLRVSPESAPDMLGRQIGGSVHESLLG